MDNISIVESASEMLSTLSITNSSRIRTPSQYEITVARRTRRHERRAHEREEKYAKKLSELRLPHADKLNVITEKPTDSTEHKVFSKHKKFGQPVQLQLLDLVNARPHRQLIDNIPPALASTDRNKGKRREGGGPATKQLSRIKRSIVQSRNERQREGNDCTVNCENKMKSNLRTEIVENDKTDIDVVISSSIVQHNNDPLHSRNFRS